MKPNRIISGLGDKRAVLCFTCSTQARNVAD